jgi:hypothetical protein
LSVRFHGLLAAVETAFDALREKLAGRAAANDESAALHRAMGDHVAGERCEARARAYWVAADDVDRARIDLLVEWARCAYEQEEADDNEVARDRSKEAR